MKSSVYLAFVFAAGMALFSIPANAQATRTWVSGVGDDANPCSRTAPCKTWPGAISKTAAGGEIDALDPGGFGTVTIIKAITLDGGGGQVASILASGTNAINVNATTNDIVIIRNLRINGISGTGSGGTNGIVFNSGAALIVENCDIFGFVNSGIQFSPSTNAKMVVANSHLTNNATATGNAAILVSPTGTGNASATINNVYMEDQINGVFANGTGSSGATHVNVRDSVITGSTNNGVTVVGVNATGDVFNTQISYSVNTGAAVGSGSLRLGGNTITNNVTGAAAAGGTLQSFKNNLFADNGSDGTPITAVPGYSGGGQ
jgi:hypothetical protein